MESKSTTNPLVVQYFGTRVWRKKGEVGCGGIFDSIWSFLSLPLMKVVLLLLLFILFSIQLWHNQLKLSENEHLQHLD